MSSKQGKLEVVLIPPLLTTDFNVVAWDRYLADKPKAVIFETFGSGSVGSAFVPKIRETVRMGIPVFLLSSMERGTIRSVVYDQQEQALQAGAVHLERINFGDVKRAWQGQSQDPTHDVIPEINRLAHESKDMFDLIDKVRATYNLTEEEIDVLPEIAEGVPDREAIMRTRGKVDEMLAELKREMDGNREIEHSGEVKR